MEAMINVVGVEPVSIVYLDDKEKDAFEARGLGVHVIIYERGHIKELDKQLAELGVSPRV